MKTIMEKHWDTRGRTGTVCKNGYRLFSKGKRGELVREYEHRIVWESNFGTIPDGFQIHHKDGNKLNNNINNLELIKRGEHQKIHALENNLGKDRKGISPINKTKNDTINKIKLLRKNGKLLADIVKITGLSYPTVQKYAKEM